MVIIKSGSLWAYKDKVYQVDSLVSMKHPDTGAWLVAVRYQPYHESDKEGLSEYVREIEDFGRKFKRQETL